MQFKSVQEADLDISLSDGKKIKCIVRGDLSSRNPIILLLHGLTGESKETLQYLGSRYLHEHGFVVVSVALYSFGKEYRSIFTAGLETNMSDFTEVVEWLRKNYQTTIFAIGHSYGGLAILGSAASIDGAVLWDPSHGLVFREPDSDEYPEKVVARYRIGIGGSGYVYPEFIAEYNKNLGDTSSWAANKAYPIKFIAAGKGVLHGHVKGYFEQADDPKEYSTIENASHQFIDSDETVQQLFAETVEWLKKHS